jgi:hypothetical protein
MSSVFSTSLNPLLDQSIYFKLHPLRIPLLTCHQNFQSFDTWSVPGSNILQRSITYQVIFKYKISSDFPIESKSFHVIVGMGQQILPKLHFTSQEAITWMLQTNNSTNTFSRGHGGSHSTLLSCTMKDRSIHIQWYSKYSSQQLTFTPPSCGKGDGKVKRHAGKGRPQCTQLLQFSPSHKN